MSIFALQSNAVSGVFRGSLNTYIKNCYEALHTFRIFGTGQKETRRSQIAQSGRTWPRRGQAPWKGGTGKELRTMKDQLQKILNSDSKGYGNDGSVLENISW